MENLFEEFRLGSLKFLNKFVLPPIKLGAGNPDGTVTERQLLFYEQIAEKGPALIILEPVSVTPDGKEHPRQLCAHLPESGAELKRIVDVVHGQGRLACLHLNHAGAAANPMATKTKPKAPSSITCPASGQESEPMSKEDIKAIIGGYKSAAKKALAAGFDMIEIQAGHGYLVSQFLNGKINKRSDAYGQDRLLFAQEVLTAVREGAPDLPLLVRISGNEMSPEFGIGPEDLLPFAWVRGHTTLPLIVAGRMGRKDRIERILANGLADLFALGRPLIADPRLIERWGQGKDNEARLCAYCLQGCLHRVKSGQPLGCNVNPEIGLPPLKPAERSRKVLVAGGGPAGMSAALYLTRRGHRVTLVEKESRLGGQFALAWQAPGKEKMKEGLESIERSLRSSGATILLDRSVYAAAVGEFQPDLLVWATGGIQNFPEILGLENQYTLTSVEYFTGEREIKGPRVLVIGAGRTGIEITEKLGREGYEVLATKRTDPIGSMMEMITKNLALKRIAEMGNVILMPHTTIKAFLEKSVDVEQDGVRMSLEPFQTVILASGMISAPGPDEEIRNLVSHIEIIGDAREVQDIFGATRAGYELAAKY
ncbi:MAG: FAD-dependent oxidoreductase [Deltaproteobacteria bacterium]